MASRSLNKVILIGNLTRDPELRYTPAGTAVCTFGLATNRTWTTQTGEIKEDTEFHRIVSWSKLAELCSQLLTKGRKVYMEGRLSTHAWTAQDGTQRTTTEIVIEDMIILDSKRPVKEEGVALPSVPVVAAAVEPAVTAAAEETTVAVASDQAATTAKKSTSAKKKKEEETSKVEKLPTSEDITPEDIPF